MRHSTKFARIRNIIKNKPYLVWYTGNIDSLSEESIFEHVLNYGNWEDVQEFIKSMGINESLQIFKKLAGQKRPNLRPEIRHFFNLYFKKHAASGIN